MKREVNSVVGNALTAAELIERLQEMDPESPVFFVCDYGDYSHTQQALPVEDVETANRKRLNESAYSQSGVSLIEDDEDELYYCEKCERELTVTYCPKCKTVCLNEEGEPAINSDDDDDEPYADVIILQ